MTIFAVVAISPTSQGLLDGKISAHYGIDSRRVSDGVWLVSDPGVAKDVSDKLGITGGETGQGLVFAVGGYYGLASNDIWEWMALKRVKGGLVR